MQEGREYVVTGGQADLKLDRESVPEFLEWLFSNIANRLPSLKLMDTAKVVRYLQLLRTHGVPNEIAQKGPEAIADYRKGEYSPQHREMQWAATGVADCLWSELALGGEVVPSRTVASVKAFVKEHSGYFPMHHELLLNALSNFAIPTNEDRQLAPARFASRSLRTHSSGNKKRKLTDDLSERIFAAYHALHKAGLTPTKSYSSIAAQLEKQGIPRKRGGMERGGWTDFNVLDRVRRYEKAIGDELRQDLKRAPTSSELTNRYSDVIARHLRVFLDPWPNERSPAESE